MMVETIHLAHVPPELAIFVALFSNVENAPFLKEQLITANSDFEYAFIDASMVLNCPQATGNGLIMPDCLDKACPSSGLSRDE